MSGFAQPLLAVIGQPVSENPSQLMIERAFAAAALDGRCVTIEVSAERLPAALEGLRALGFEGAAIARPHKVPVISLLDEIAPSARLIGAVNCIVRDGERFVGHNTDGRGFVSAVRDRIPLKGAHVQILGAGGTARAIAVEVTLAGATEVSVLSRDESEGQDVVDLCDEAGGKGRLIPWMGPAPVLPEAQILVNATPVGVFPDVEARLELDHEGLRPSLLVCDVIPNPRETVLLREARARGCPTVDGWEILVGQGIISFELWAKRSAEAATMLRALEEHFEA